MSFLVIFIGSIAVLFALAYVTKRRIGVLGLSLAAGALLASMWVGDLTPLIAQAGIVIVQPPLQSLVAMALTLLPAIVLVTSGPKYKSGPQRLLGAATFALLAVALLLPSIGSALVIDAAGRPVYDFFNQYRPVIVTAGLLLSLFDIVAVKTPKHDKH